jgi:hypothetical protein
VVVERLRSFICNAEKVKCKVLMKMMHEDSNGESTFEFVEKRVDELSIISNETVPRPGP